MFKLIGITLLYIISLLAALVFAMPIEKVLAYVSFILITEITMTRIAALMVVSYYEAKKGDSDDTKTK
jgi:LytS/YehU family sensor histidine kinase